MGRSSTVRPDPQYGYSPPYWTPYHGVLYTLQLQSTYLLRTPYRIFTP